MKFTGLHSAALPNTSDTVKECVNLGQWMLFKSNEQPTSVMFYLKTEHDIYELNESGQVLPTPVARYVEMDEVFYFLDITRPASLSNTTFLALR
ncbi:hypothetical protein [Enterobacter bugandensis]|uniref:hypothetical protein n=1 Tax=Enterobacter bugandensis TaxID=881260 RepID=UPI0007A4EBE4|nr:hypothetical protein [Enterobacter bugandensis]EMC1013076.1 hypothetical protein [Enterobacter bugandensis]